MAKEADEAAPEGAEAPGGVFGNLPSTRPGSRSPRRRGKDGGAKPAELKAKPVASQSAAKPKPKPKPPRKPGPPRAEQPPADRPEPAPAPGRPGDPLEPSPGIHGVEDLAWAGVAVAAQAATAGVRFASRALEAARKSIDRP